MALTIGEANDLVFDRRAVSGTLAYYLSAVKRRAVHVGPDYLMCLLVCVCDPARHHRALDSLMHEAERDNLGISVLTLHLIQMQGRKPDSCRSSGLQAAYRKAFLLQGIAKSDCGLLSESAGAVVVLAYEDASVHEGSGG